MANLINFTCPICHVTRTVYRSELHKAKLCCGGMPLQRPPCKQVNLEDVTQPILFALAGLAENNLDSQANNQYKRPASKQRRRNRD